MAVFYKLGVLIGCPCTKRPYYLGSKGSALGAPDFWKLPCNVP